MPPHVVEAAARRGGAAGLRADARRARPARGDRGAALGELGGRSIRSARCSSRSADAGAPPRRAALRCALRLARAVFFFPQVVAATGGCAATAATRPARLGSVRGGDRRRDDPRDREHAGQPDRLVFRPTDLDAIAAALVDSNALLLSDEAYAGILYDGRGHLSPGSHPELRERTLVLRSFSKTYAMAAWRVGLAVGPAAAIATMAQAFAWQALAVDGVAQAVAHAALTGPQGWIGPPGRAGRDAPAGDRGGEREAGVPSRASGSSPRSSGPPSTATRTPGAIARQRAWDHRPSGQHSPPRRLTSGSRSAACPRRARRCSSGWPHCLSLPVNRHRVGPVKASSRSTDGARDLHRRFGVVLDLAPDLGRVPASAGARRDAAPCRCRPRPPRR